MKRREMITIMMEFERNAQEYKCGKMFMSNLLKTLEEAGMMPPPKNQYKADFSLEDFEWEEE